MIEIGTKADEASKPPATMTRRRFLRSAVSLAAGASVGYMQRVVLSRLNIDAPPGSPGLRGLRIAFVTDIHRSIAIGRGFVEHAASRLTALSPDVVLLGGDYATAFEGRPELIDETLEIMASVGAPLGCYAVGGNHDLTLRPGGFFAASSPSSVRPLVNSSVTLRYGAEQFAIVGLDDALMGHPDPDVAYGGIPASVPVILLGHEPDMLMDLVPSHLPSWLALCGHLHGGQIRVPLYGAPIIPTAYRNVFDWGWASPRGRRTYVSRGLGVTGPLPLRAFCPPEICLFDVV